MILLTTRTDTAIEVETLCHRCITQIVGCARDKAPLHHITILSRLDTSHQCVGAFEEGRLSNHHLLQILGLNALSIHHLHQRQVGILRLKLLKGHLVVVGLRVTEFSTRLRHLGQSRLHLHDVLHLLRGHAFTKAKQLEHLYYVLLKGFTDIGCSLIVIEVILLLSQRQATLIDVQDILRGVLIVGTETTEEELLFSVWSQLQLDVQQLLVGLGSLQFLDQGHQGSHTLVVTTCGVHSQLVEIAEFLLNRTLLVGIALQFLQNTVDALVVVLLQTIKTTIA